MSENVNNEENKKTKTIRGVDQGLYNKILEVARSSGKTVGEIVNQSFKSFLELSNTAKKTITGAIESGKTFIGGVKEGMGNIVLISDIEELTISKQELNEISKPIAIRNVKRLNISELSQEEIDKYIQEITNVDEIIVSEKINKIKLFQKCKKIKRISVMQSEK
jgi:hypothetical protein